MCKFGEVGFLFWFVEIVSIWGIGDDVDVVEIESWSYSDDEFYLMFYVIFFDVMWIVK